MLTFLPANNNLSHQQDSFAKKKNILFSSPNKSSTFQESCLVFPYLSVPELFEVETQMIIVFCSRVIIQFLRTIPWICYYRTARG